MPRLDRYDTEADPCDLVIGLVRTGTRARLVRMGDEGGGQRDVAPQKNSTTCWKRLPAPNVVPIARDAVPRLREAERDERSAISAAGELGWECGTCTYVNSVGHHGRCAMCDSPRRHLELVPAPAPQHCPEPEQQQRAGPSVVSDADEAECAICIDEMVAADVASAECGHEFCTACILQWLDTGHQHCPMCKASITHLRVRRQLDGTRIDTPVSEPVVLLLRARWRECPAVLPLDNTLGEALSSEPGIGEWTSGIEEEDELLLRGRASSRVAAEHRALVRAAGGSTLRRATTQTRTSDVGRSAVRSLPRGAAARSAAPISPFAGMVGCKYRCVAPKAYATDEVAPTPRAGLEVSVVEHDTVITCLEARMVAGSGSKGQCLRLRCEAGWVSYVAANGTQLFELESAADGSTPHSVTRTKETKASRTRDKATKKQRREEKAAAKAARRREQKLAQVVDSTQTPPATPRASKPGGGGQNSATVL